MGRDGGDGKRGRDMGREGGRVIVMCIHTYVVTDGHLYSMHCLSTYVRTYIILCQFLLLISNIEHLKHTYVHSITNSLHEQSTRVQTVLANLSQWHISYRLVVRRMRL